MASASRPPPPSARIGDLPAALGELPVFPLPNAVLMPGALLPLHIFEPRYRALVRHALETHRALAIAQLIDGPPDEHGNPPFATIAGAGHIVDHTELPDGRCNILVRGEARVKLVELPFLPPFRRASAEILIDRGEQASHDDITVLMTVATAFATDIRQENPGFDFEIPAGLPRERFADFVAHYLVVDAATRQAILETLDPAARAQMTLQAIATQRAQSRRSNSGPPSLAGNPGRGSGAPRGSVAVRNSWFLKVPERSRWVAHHVPPMATPFPSGAIHRPLRGGADTRSRASRPASTAVAAKAGSGAALISHWFGTPSEYP
jgi:Lon protease-like protein